MHIMHFKYIEIFKLYRGGGGHRFGQMLEGYIQIWLNARGGEHPDLTGAKPEIIHYTPVLCFLSSS